MLAHIVLAEHHFAAVDDTGGFVFATEAREAAASKANILFCFTVFFSFFIMS